MAESLMHKVFHKRAKHPISYGLLDLTLSGAALLPQAPQAAHDIFALSSIMQTQEGMHPAPVPGIAELHTGLALDAVVISSLYFAYYFTGLRPLNPVVWYQTARKATEHLRRKS